MINKIRKMLELMYQKKVNNYLESLKIKGLKLGKGTSILEPFFLDPDHCYLISIGENCTLAPNVRLIAHDASTKLHLNFTRIGKITIGNNCFIGDSTIILPNVSIGSNSIIGSGSIVNKSIPENSVAAGNPAKVLCTLDDYLNRVKIKAEEKGVFSEEYDIDKISPSQRAEVIQALSDGEGYIK